MKVIIKHNKNIKQRTDIINNKIFFVISVPIFVIHLIIFILIYFSISDELNESIHSQLIVEIININAKILKKFEII